jgi:hypothetical protein
VRKKETGTVIPALGRLRQEVLEFQASLSYTEILSQKKNKNKKTREQRVLNSGEERVSPR